ncbi:hypothetical protein PspLS_10983 [Pyricularia sp. CBS 133598]|nr:hypothetical protein PspLS_10983 [Pyricularia sp. CBS 133598]
MNLHTRQGRAARAEPKLRGTPLKLRRALRQAQAQRDQKLDDMERDSGANIPSRPKAQDTGRRDRRSMDLELPSRPRKSAGQHGAAQGEQARRQERLKIRLEPTSPAVTRGHQRQCPPRAPVTPPPRRSPPAETPPQGGESSSDSESDDSSSDYSSSDEEPTPAKRKAMSRVKLSKCQERDLLTEFLAREYDYLAAMANGAKCHRDMPFWVDMRKRLRLVQVTDKWSDLSRAFGIIVGARERQAMAGKKVACKNETERLIESCARIRIRRGILDGFVDEDLLNPNMVPGLIESGSLEQCELMLGEMQHLRRKQCAQEACDGTDEESDAQHESESDDGGESSESSGSSSNSRSSISSDDDGEGTNNASEAAHQMASSPPTSPIMSSPRCPHADETSSPSSTTAATYHADTDAADDCDDGDDGDDEDDEDDLTAIAQAIALLQSRQARKRRRRDSAADMHPSRRVRTQHDKDYTRARHERPVRPSTRPVMTPRAGARFDGKDRGPWPAQFKLELLKLMIANKEDWNSKDRADRRDFFDIVASQAKTKLNRVIDADDIRSRVHFTMCGPRRNSTFKTDPVGEAEKMIDEWNVIVDDNPRADSPKKLQRLDDRSVKALAKASLNYIQKARDVLLRPSSSPEQWQDAEILLAMPLVMAARDEDKSRFITPHQRNEVLSWTRSTQRTALFDLIPAKPYRPAQIKESSTPTPKAQETKCGPGQIQSLDKPDLALPVRPALEIRPTTPPATKIDVVDLTSSLPSVTGHPKKRLRSVAQKSSNDSDSDSRNILSGPRPHAAATSHPPAHLLRHLRQTGRVRADCSDSDSSVSSSDDDDDKSKLLEKKPTLNCASLPSSFTPTTYPQNKRKASFELKNQGRDKKPQVEEKVEPPKQAFQLNLGFAKAMRGPSISADEVLDRNIALGAHKKPATQPGKQKNNHNSGGIQKSNNAKKKQPNRGQWKPNQKKV